jgi:serine protease DegQ
MHRIWLIFSQTVTILVAFLFVVITFKPEWLARRPNYLLPQAVPIQTAKPTAASGNLGLSQAASVATPAVVSIVASKKAKENPHANDPWFQFFFGDNLQNEQPQQGLGSGVIVSEAGYLLTNNHVIDDADEIEVQLSDGRQGRAQIVGTDPDTDLAVLKIELSHLPVITWGSMDRIHIGDAVLAIGNPFGVGQTVTSGIVSALGRSRLGLSTYENFIQTDAAINPGNSGGALVDANGLLVGINTAIFSRSGGNMGIGFAIPVDKAKKVMEMLIRQGHVTRGWIGVEPRDISLDMAKSLNLSSTEGVIITGLLQGGPAHKAGIRPGDVITQIDNKIIKDTETLLNLVSELIPERTYPVVITRDKKNVQVNVQVSTRPAPKKDSVTP